MSSLPKMTFRPAPALPTMSTNDSALEARTDARKTAQARPANGFADHLRIELSGLVAYEMEVTVQVGVMLSAGISQTQICHSLAIDSTEFKMCKRRLQQVAKEWIDE